MLPSPFSSWVFLLPLFCFFWAAFPLGRPSCSSFFPVHGFLLFPPSLPLLHSLLLWLVPSVVCLLSTAPPGTLICCSFPYRLYTTSWGFVCMRVCDSIKQNTIKSGKTERHADRQRFPALRGLSLSACELGPGTAFSCRHVGLLVATLRISCLGFPSLRRDPGTETTSALLSGAGAAPSDER